MWPEAQKCRNYWWANVLAISNFIGADDQVSGIISAIQYN